MYLSIIRKRFSSLKGWLDNMVFELKVRIHLWEDRHERLAEKAGYICACFLSWVCIAIGALALMAIFIALLAIDGLLSSLL